MVAAGANVAVAVEVGSTRTICEDNGSSSASDAFGSGRATAPAGEMAT